MSMPTGFALSLALGCGVAVAVPAIAVDGVIEVNQARALAGGVTAGDAPGFPVTIAQPGSYRLTGTLDVSGQPAPENVSAITITASFVTLDLNGFSIVGATVCTGSPVDSCAPSGTGNGIDSAAANFVRISGGAVHGFGNHGVVAGNAIVERVDTFGNAGNGFWIQAGGRVARSSAIGNGVDGIAGAGLLVESSRALENGWSGFYVYPGEVRGSEAVHNGAFGIYVGSGVAIANLSRANLGCAIDAPGGGYAENVASGSPTLCDGIELGANLCNGALCP